ncbi:PREDICTED: uncharacterized protein LOC105556974 isoform X2 [Vollenhovia emeryi]|uniref:uncharacterized protein LOC105556974 isoform X2 n=1 Tax=Vollenhovia emeryi TaxID=411798 RepID=UPI0005F4D615|nr:PREDICTED: uncharacterized protein LOC105556974 isoform X2 [Vollenhovia emeryi]
MPSSHQIEKCDKCGEHKTEQLTLRPNHNTIIKKGFRALNKALQFHEITYNKRCHCRGCSTLTTETNFHIFIELDIRENLHSGHSKSCKLEELPLMLKLAKQYRLVGVIARYPGHFVVYCR